MLEPSDRKKLDDYLDKIFDDLKKNIESLKKNNRYSDKELREKVVSITVNKITPESKIILSSTYNMLESNTFKEDYFNDTTNKAKFYKLCILEDIIKKINFEIPKDISYKQDVSTVNKITLTIATGTIFSFIMKNPGSVLIYPFIIALMDRLQKNSNKKTNKDSDKVIEEYLDSVRKFLDNLIKDIVSYYDERIEELKREIHQKSK